MKRYSLKSYKKNRPVAVKIVKKSGSNNPLLSGKLSPIAALEDKKEKVKIDDYKYPWE